MRKIITDKSLKRDISAYKKLLRTKFSMSVHEEKEKLAEKADYLLDLYENNKLPFDKISYPVFANYIDTFAYEEQAERLFDKMKVRDGFDAKEYFRNRKVGIWERLFGEKSYLSAKQLDKKSRQYLDYRSQTKKEFFFSATQNKIIKLINEATSYVIAFNNDRIVIKPEDYKAFDRYIGVILADDRESKDVSSAKKKLKSLMALQQNVQLQAATSTEQQPKQEQKVVKKSGMWANLWQKIKSVNPQKVKNAVKLALTTSAIVISGLFVSKSGNTMNKNKISAPKENINTVPQKTYITAEDTETFAKIIAAENTVQPNTTSKSAENTESEQKIWNNYYDNTIEILSSAKEKSKLYAQIENQLKKGIFTLPENVSKERLAYTYLIYRAYSVKSSLERAINGKEKLNNEMQSQIVQDIEAAGSKGNGVKQIAAKQGKKLTSYSRYDKAGSRLQQKHISNLKELRQLHKMQMRTN
jgi:hypothetical protein